MMTQLELHRAIAQALESEGIYPDQALVKGTARVATAIASYFLECDAQGHRTYVVKVSKLAVYGLFYGGGLSPENSHFLSEARTSHMQLALGAVYGITMSHLSATDQWMFLNTRCIADHGFNLSKNRLMQYVHRSGDTAPSSTLLTVAKPRSVEHGTSRTQSTDAAGRTAAA